MRAATRAPNQGMIFIHTAAAYEEQLTLQSVIEGIGTAITGITRLVTVAVGLVWVHNGNARQANQAF